MVSVKVNNDDIWDNYVKKGKVKGFSIEAFFTDKLNASKQDVVKDLFSLSDEEKIQIMVGDLITYYNG
jgi:hypothetical protein